MSHIYEILEQYVEESSILWERRKMAVYEPHYNLLALLRLDDRIEAHIDGLRIADDAGWEICSKDISAQEPADLFTPTVISFGAGKAEWIRQVLEAGVQSVEHLEAMVSGMSWISFTNAREHALNLLGSENKMFQLAGVCVFASHRQDPGPDLIKAIVNDDSKLRTAGITAAAQLGKKELLPTIKEFLDDDTADCRFAAAWATALFGDKDAVPVLRDIVQKGGKSAHQACSMALRNMDIDNGLDWLIHLEKLNHLKRTVIIGYGVLGDPVAVPWLIDMMQYPPWARVAGESLSMITGVDLQERKLTGKKPEGFESGPTDDPADADVDVDPDEDLPWPGPEVILSWWSEQRRHFKNRTRFFLGHPLKRENLMTGLKNGFQRQRAYAAIELTLDDHINSRTISPGSPLFDVCDRAARQKKLLGL